MTPRVLVTGGQGLVGKALTARMLAEGLSVRVSTRQKLASTDNRFEYVQATDLSSMTDWLSALQQVEIIVHLAARVHVTEDRVADPLAEFRKVNVEGTLGLARQAADVGVRRFVFLSSIKVNGEQTQAGQGYTSNDTPKPSDPYGISKYEAENGLRQIAEETGMEVVIIRPVLVYGPGVKGNFLSMMLWLYKGVPLPLGAINNVRSLVALDNLVDLVVLCLRHPAAANQTFLVSDGEDISTTDLLKRTASAMGVKARLMPVPLSILQVGTRLLGKRAIGQRLCGSLKVDISKTRKVLGWAPPVTVDQALEKTAEYFLRNQVG